MTPRFRWFGSILATLALVGCLGGQTGEPSAELGEDCPNAEEFAGLGCHCRYAALDEVMDGFTPQDAIPLAELEDVPLFWTPPTAIQEDAELHRLEFTDVRAETRLNLRLQADPSRRVVVCDGNKVYVPVDAELETVDGIDVSFQATVLGHWSSPDGLPLRALVRTDEAPGTVDNPFPWADECSSYSLRPLGTFCHPEKGRATWPTPCGGEFQEPPDVALEAGHPSPEQFFEGTEKLTLVEESSLPNPPPITLSLAIDDENACYAHSSYDLDVKLTVETDGVTFSDTIPFHRPDTDIADTEIMSAYSDVCGDVSASAAWKELQSSTGDSTLICVLVWYGRDTRGLSAAAEVGLDSTGYFYGFSP